MAANDCTRAKLDPNAFAFYRHAFEIMATARISFMLGGAYALGHYTGIIRHTKDLDIFVRAADVQATLAAFEAAGYRTQVLFSHWLAKAFYGDDFVDIIFSSGNGICAVDDIWFAHAPRGEVLGTTMRLVPVEEMIWQKAFIMERERFDGADVNHLLRAHGRNLDWERLLARFGPYWRVLLGHLIWFGFVYPDKRDSIPGEVFSKLVTRLHEVPEDGGAACMGTVLSRMQYLTDIEEWNYADARQAPIGPLTKEQVVRWTNAGR